MMRSILKLSYKFFTAKRGRSFFSILGISLGILLITTVQVVFATLSSSYTALERQKYGDYDVIAYYQSRGSSLNNEDLRTLRSIKGVTAVQPILYPYQGNLPTVLSDSLFYVGLTDSYLSRQLRTYDVVQGHFPRPHEIALSPEFMLRHDLKIGSTVEINFPKHGRKLLTISGMLPPSPQVNLGTAVFDYSWLQLATGDSGDTTGVVIKLNPTLTSGEKDSILQAIGKKLYKMAPNITVDTREQLTQQTRNMAGFLPLVRGISISAILASVFVVLSTLQISMQERRKDFGILRLLGVRGSQFTLLIVMESVMYGVLSTVVGISLGIGISYIVKGFTSDLFHIPLTSISLSWPVLGWIAISSIVMILLAGLIPGLWARRLSPMEAYRSGVNSEDFSNSVHSFVAPGLVTTSLGVALWTHLMKLHLLVYPLCGLAFVIGLYIWIPHILNGLSRFLTWSLKSLIGPNIALACRNLSRYRRRSALSVGVLMLAVTIGMAGTIILRVVSYGQEQMTEFNYPQDISLRSVDLRRGISADLATQISHLKGVQMESFTNFVGAVVLNSRYHAMSSSQSLTSRGLVPPSNVTLLGTNLLQDQRIEHFSVIDGHINPRALAQGGVVLTKTTAQTLGFKAGDTLKLKPYSQRVPVSLKVIAIIQGPSSTFSSPFLFTDPSIIERIFSVRALSSILIKVTSADTQSVIRNLDAMLQNPLYQNVQLINQSEEKKAAQEPVLLFLIVMIATVMTITCIATLALMNHVTSSVRQRIRELATTRAIGMTRAQVVRLILTEGIVTSILGSALGIITGGALAYSALLALIGGHSISFPFSWVYGTILVSPFLGLLASVSAATWASKQDILATLSQY